MDGYEDRLSGNPLEVGDDGVDETEDTLTFANGVIEKIVALGLRDVPNIAGMSGTLLNRVKDAFGMSDAGKGVAVVMLPDGDISVSISVIMVYGAYAPQIFDDVKEATLRAMKEMTGLTVRSVNLRIEDVLTPEEIPDGSHRHLLASASDDVVAES